MKALSDLLPTTQIKTADEQKADRIKFEYQHYGLLICEVLKLEPKFRGRIIGFVKRNNNGYALQKKVNELLQNQKFLSMNQEQRIRYLFGAYRRSV